PDEAYLVPSDRPFLFVAALLRSCFRGPKGLASLSSRSRSPSGTPIPRRARNWIRNVCTPCSTFIVTHVENRLVNLLKV
ncbi:unnamed protein product, partial [Tenebrio molitor]